MVNSGKKFGKDNKGYMIVSILFIMLFVSACVVLVMTQTILNVQMKDSDRRSKKYFYEAERYVDEIQAGIEVELGQALEKVQRDLLPQYGTMTNPELESRYGQDVVSILFKQFTGENYSTSYANDKKYDLDVLKSYLSNSASSEFSEVTIGFGANACVYVDNTNYKDLTLRQIQISCKTDAGYITKLSLDFKVEIPSINFANSDFYLVLGDYSIITDQNLLNNQAQKSDIRGNVYAGKDIIVQGENSELSFHSDDIVTRKNLRADTGGKVTVNGINDFCNIWADSICTSSELDNRSTAKTSVKIENTRCYIKNDLLLNGNENNDVSIQGEYFGFGNDSADVKKNSAIIINGRKSVLDLSGVSKLVLGGRAFIDVDGSPSSEGVLVGESLAVKGNQIAYLVPNEFVRGGSNPCTPIGGLGSTDLEIDFRPKSERSFKNKGDEYKKFLNTYLPSGDLDILKYLDLRSSTPGYKKVFSFDKAGQQQVYYYLVFSSDKAANAFFNAYYIANDERLNQRTKQYAESIKVADDVNLYSVVGNLTLYDEINQKVNLIYTENPASVDAMCISLQNQYESMIYNLYKNGGGGSITPNSSIFDSFIDSTQFKAPDTPQESYLVGLGSKAIFINNPSSAFNISTEFGGIEGKGIIVATGKVLVDKDFKGTIIAKGGIEFVGGHKLEADRFTVNEILSAGNKNITKFFRNIDSSLDDLDEHSTSNIDIHKLVKIQNWKKE